MSIRYLLIVLCLLSMCALGACGNKQKQEQSLEKNIPKAFTTIEVPFEQKNNRKDSLVQHRQLDSGDRIHGTNQDVLTKLNVSLNVSIKSIVDSCIHFYNNQEAKEFNSYQHGIKQDSFCGNKVAYIELSKETWSETIFSFSLDFFDENLIGFNKFWLINDSLLRIETYLLEASTTETGMQVQAILQDQFYYQNEHLIQTEYSPSQQILAFQRLNQWKTLQYKSPEKD